MDEQNRYSPGYAWACLADGRFVLRSQEPLHRILCEIAVPLRMDSSYLLCIVECTIMEE